MYLLNCFFLYSILGFLAETIYALVMGYDFSSGILYGPWTIVYGIGSVLIIIIADKLFKNLHMNRFVETIIVFLMIIIVLTLLEWLGGVLIEWLFGITFWDYSDSKYHIGKYISLGMSLVWGFMGIIFIYLIKPITDKIVGKIPKWVTYTLCLLFLIDVVVTCLARFKVI